MADIYHIHELSKVSLRTLRKLERLGFLKNAESENPLASKINYNLRKGNALSVVELAALLQDDELWFYLGDYVDRAKTQVAALGKVDPDKVPSGMASTIELAARDDPQGVAPLVDWMKATIPEAGDVSHHFLAVRLLLGVPETQRDMVAGWIPRAFLNCRKFEAFAGWWKVTGKPGARLTIYYQPHDLPLDL